jgi:hypothetical protein
VREHERAGVAQELGRRRQRVDVQLEEPQPLLRSLLGIVDAHYHRAVARARTADAAERAAALAEARRLIGVAAALRANAVADAPDRAFGDDLEHDHQPPVARSIRSPNYLMSP